MTPSESAHADIVATLATVADQHEGLRDFARLNLLPETQRDVRLLLEVFDRRVQRLTAAKTALELLIADGTPERAAREVAEAVLRDLKQNARSIEAALPLFMTPDATAVRLGLAAQATEPK